MSSVFESLRAARALLNVSQVEMTGPTGLSQADIARLEKHDFKMVPRSAYILKAHLEKQGIEFLEETDRKGLGVRWKNPGRLEPFNAAQIRTARVMLGLSQRELAEKTDLHRTYIVRLEGGKPKSVDLGVVKKIIEYFEKNGVEFISESAQHGSGVRLSSKNPYIKV